MMPTFPRELDNSGPLTSAEIESFIRDGFVRIDHVFPREVASESRKILWRSMSMDAGEPRSWKDAVKRVICEGAPFKDAVQAPRLQRVFDQLVGKGRWVPREHLGIFVVRFPSEDDPGDTGWHVDASFPPAENPAEQNFLNWRVNVFSKERALLMLFLFSDVGEADAPTRIRAGSHFDVARMLEAEGVEGLSSLELARKLNVTEPRPEVLATGEAGTVYLCHPFLVHAAQRLKGSQPRFLAQPPLALREPFRLDTDEAKASPVERAIQLGLASDTAKSSAFKKLPT
jgi:hypothetical protein